MNKTKYVTRARLRFRDASGKRWQLEEGTVMSFSEGDRIDVDFLRLCGAIELHQEPKQKDRGKHDGEHS